MWNANGAEHDHVHAKKQDLMASERLVDDMVSAQENPKTIDVKSSPHARHLTIYMLVEDRNNCIAKPKGITDLESENMPYFP
ncbi:hypothetical protein [Xanthomonas arboricola]|uniref:hypothetical protein n=1 Tax=Xanthomonas arboricola TaxID=56448 RepID=UPI001610DBC1|nr:hypothetical protein [Xanthomonas arboricola]MBB3759564.1 hypothetical protein [Xanthomonas arboricola]